MWDGAFILTASGPVPLETLTSGSDVLTASGRSRRIASVTRRSVADAVSPEPVVRIVAHALGGDRPAQDIDLVPEAPVMFEDTIVAAKALVNGATITSGVRAQAERPWEVALEPDEAGSASAYVPLFNGEGYVHADTELPPSLAEALAPTAIRRRLIDVATGRGHVLTGDADLHAVVDGVAIAARRPRMGRFIFTLPRDATSLRLVSRAWVPSEVVPESTDNRVLGVCVRRLVLDGHEIDLAGLDEGWDKVEDHGRFLVRWTRGSAVVPLSNPRSLDVDLHGYGYYWADAEDPGGALTTPRFPLR